MCTALSESNINDNKKKKKYLETPEEQRARRPLTEFQNQDLEILERGVSLKEEAVKLLRINQFAIEQIDRKS